MVVVLQRGVETDPHVFYCAISGPLGNLELFHQMTGVGITTSFNACVKPIIPLVMLPYRHFLLLCQSVCSLSGEKNCVYKLVSPP
jgi:hypothetical protein